MGEKVQRVLAVPDKLYDVIPKSWAGAVVRGVRAALSLVLATVIATVTDGSVFKEVHIINADQVPLAIAVLTPLLQAIDKKLRDAGIIDKQPELLIEPPDDIPTSSAVGDPQDSIVDPPIFDETPVTPVE